EPAGRGERGVEGGVAARQEAVAGPDAATILRWLDALETADRETSIFGSGDGPKSLALPRTLGSDAFEVVGVPLAGNGLHIVEVESQVLGASLLGKAKPMYVAAGALVTNLGVHFEWGDESSLVWVTTLDRAEPVPGARVTVANCRGETLAEAKTDGQGLARFDSLPSDRDVPSCHSLHYSPYLEGLLVVAAVDGDLGFVHTSWSEGIEPWRFKLPTTWRPETLKAHSVLDRSLLRAGDTLHMKHVLRRAVQAGFAQVPPPERPEKLEIVHVGTDERWELPLSWGPDGAAVNEWTIPREAKLGGYELRMR